MDIKFIDFHCHSALKPYSKSLRNKYPDYENSDDHKDESSIWHQDPPYDGDVLLNGSLTITKFRQADFKTSLEGGVRVMMVSIDPMEIGFAFNKSRGPMKFTGRIFQNLVSGIGHPRLRNLQVIDDYYEDLYRNYEFMIDLNDTYVDIDGNKFKYKLVDTHRDIDYSAKNTIFIVLTIEGGHVFNTGLELANVITDAGEVINNVKRLKDTEEWAIKPFFVSLAHHFPNLICGQAESFGFPANITYNQKHDKNETISVMGEAVIEELLNNENGKRILIDLKHMNIKSRLRYYEILENKYKGENIPLIVSHGALKFADVPKKNTSEINFYNEEIVSIAKSNGIFGVQLDGRRLKKRVSRDRKRIIGKLPSRKLFRKAGFVWRQIEEMAMLLYGDTKFKGDPWGFQVIGSDFDGVIDPLNGYWTHKEMELLYSNLIRHAEAFLKTSKAKKLPNYKSLNAKTIVDKFTFKNANNFLKNHLK